MRVLATLVGGVALGAACTSPPAPMTKAELGRAAFVDQNLSQPRGQACADCHALTRAFSDPESDNSTSMGVIDGRFGPRQSPTAMYMRFAPPLHFDDVTQQWVGGLFWDGRANTLEDQATKPLLNPLEMNNPDKAAVVAAARAAAYARDFRRIYGATAFDDTDQAFVHLMDAIAAFERTPDLAPFSSKYDRYLAGAETLTDAELRGLAIFEDPARGNCASCHPSRPAADGTPPLFTNFTYANLGIPKYLNNHFLQQPPELNAAGAAFIDHGLMQTVGDAREDGKFRVPTLRNVMVTAPFGHNGYFENLPYFLDFLATRDVGSPETGAWAAPEVAANVDQRVGHLALTRQDLDDLYAFLMTLNDAAPPQS